MPGRPPRYRRSNAAVNGTASFAYDHLGRLTGYDSPISSTADRDYAWAKVASRTSVTGDPSGTPSTLTYTLDAADRITADSASGTYGTDASGRVTARTSRQFVWDSLGRLTTVRDGSGTTITTYTYDALDRVRSYTNSGTTWVLRYVGTTSSIALVRDNTAGVTDRLLLNDLAGQPWGYLSAAGTGRVSWLLNAHHDTVATFDSSGALGRYYRYTPDGAFAASGGSGITPTTRFQSSWYDLSTGLYWVVSRWYDPTTARFLSEDSLLGEPRNPDSRHRYAYGEGDPVNAWDPDGRDPIDLACSGLPKNYGTPCEIGYTGLRIIAGIVLGVVAGLAVNRSTVVTNKLSGDRVRDRVQIRMARRVRGLIWLPEITFRTPMGPRRLDICGYIDWQNTTNRPALCIEVKSGSDRNYRRYFSMPRDPEAIRQRHKDIWLSTKRNPPHEPPFSIIVTDEFGHNLHIWPVR